MKKTLAVILMLALALCVLPMNVFAAKENFIAIDAVTINEVSAPAWGTEVQFSANCTTNYTAINSVKWFEKETEAASGTALSSGAKFKPGYYYTVTVELKISNNAYSFKGNGADENATINGKTATTSSNSAQVMSVSYTFPMCLGTVSKFEFTLAAPTAGAAPYYPLLTGTGYESNNRGNNGAAYENGIYWRNETDNKVLYPDENPKFEAGKKYSANITVATTTGYRVSSSYTVKVNGKTVTSNKVDNECITFKVEFSVPKAHTHTSSDWKTDAEGHWKVCTDTACGAVSASKEAHKDANKDSKCDVCAYAIPKANTPVSDKPSTSNPSTSNSDTDTPSSNNSTASKPDADESESLVDTDAEPESLESQDSETEEEPKEEGGRNGAWVWIVLAVVILLAAGGAVTFFVLKKKKSEVEETE